MENTFRLKIGFWPRLLLLSLAVAAMLMFLTASGWMVAVALLVLVAIVPGMFNAHVDVDRQGRLFFCYGFFRSAAYPLQEVCRVRRSERMLDRGNLLLYKKEGYYLAVSPEKESEFIRLLHQFNGGLVVE